MACGDKEACPKGGRPEYRNGPQYELVQGKPQGDRMHAKNEKACGYGLYADEPCVYTTIEQKVSALRMWYDFRDFRFPEISAEICLPQPESASCSKGNKRRGRQKSLIAPAPK